MEKALFGLYKFKYMKVIFSDNSAVFSCRLIDEEIEY